MLAERACPLKPVGSGVGAASLGELHILLMLKKRVTGMLDVRTLFVQSWMPKGMMVYLTGANSFSRSFRPPNIPSVRENGDELPLRRGWAWGILL